MHIVLLAADGRSPTEIARVLFCSKHHRLCGRRRFIREEQAAFDDRKRRGPKPLLGEPANEYIERLVEEESPTSHGWLRSRWSCKLLAVELFKERAALVSRETVRRVLHRLGFRWRRPRPVPPEKGSEEQQERKRSEALGCPFDGRGSGLVLPGRDHARDQPQSGLVLDAQREAEAAENAGDQPQGVDQRGAQLPNGALALGTGERKNDELFMKLLDQLRRTYRCHKELHLAVDNDSSHTSKRVEKYVEDSGGRIRLHPLPSWSPESNPVELVWWSLHEAVSRNHECAGLDDLVEFAEDYSRSDSPSGSNSGSLRAVGKGAAMRSASVHLSCGPI